MKNGNDHPFCVDVKECRYADKGRFGWRIMSRQGGTWRSTVSYATFEDARRDAKSRLDELIAEWRSLQVTAA